MDAPRAQWGSRLGFILAAAGSAVGLGNIWRFPFAAGENGGGLFVLLYLICVALIGVPIMMSEIMIGRAAQRQPVAAFHKLQGGRSAWAGVGWLGVFAGFIILSYYIVIAGWAMDYTLKSIVNFSEPIAQQAKADALAYRASTPIEEMREGLIEEQAERIYNEEEPRIVRQVRPSSWNAYLQFKAAVDAAANPEPAAVDAAEQETAVNAAVDLDEARARLREKPELAAQVAEAEPIQEQLDAARDRARLQAEAECAGMTDTEVRDQSEDRARRAALAEGINGAFGAVAGDGWTTTFWTALFMMITILIVAGGIASGIERACLILMPALFILILILVVYGMFKPGFGEALSFVFQPHLHDMRPSGVLAAMGQSFFSLSLGMGAMITYGSYVQSKRGLVNESITIAGLDTAVALLACLMIFPIVFSFGQEPSAGPGLVFMSMPLAFAEIGQGGMVLGTIFFGLLVFAALTSSISLLEVVASYFIDERGWARRKAVWMIGGLIFLLSLPSAFAGDPDFALSGWQASYGTDFLTTLDYLASNWMLPVGGFFIAIYAGWVMPRRIREAELEGMVPFFLMGWMILVRIVAPAVVILVLLQSIGILDADDLLHGLFN